jgi:C1A family cysteine protease
MLVAWLDRGRQRGRCDHEEVIAVASEYATGWLRDRPDFRDYTPETDSVQQLMGSLKVQNPPGGATPKSVDCSQYCSPIENQGSLGSCTAQAGVGLLEYYENRAFGRFLDGSRLFLYKATRNLLQLAGDTGAWLRSTMSAMVLFGVPPEKYWPYQIAQFDDEPSAFCYSFARNYKSITYYRLDLPGMSTDAVLKRVKLYLRFGYPSMFGFTVFNFGNEEGEFAFPGPDASVKGGHAMVAVGYDDDREIGSEKGALKVRNSWGTGWGEGGYGWLPYKYVEAGLAVDFWSLFKADYLETNKFE